jgi:hypothetical protein
MLIIDLVIAGLCAKALAHHKYNNANNKYEFGRRHRDT